MDKEHVKWCQHERTEGVHLVLSGWFGTLGNARKEQNDWKQPLHDSATKLLNRIGGDPIP